MKSTTCALLELPKMTDPRGNLSFVEETRHIPFAIRRVFFLYDVPSAERRAGHALRRCHQFIIAMSGSFDVLVDYGGGRERFRLSRADHGLYLPPLVWREIENFSTNSVCLVLASEFYDIQDYVDTYEDFLKVVGPPSR